MLKKNGLRRLVFLVILSFLLNMNLSLAIPDQALAAGQEDTLYSAEDLVRDAVEFIHDRYQAGEDINPYTAYVLTLAGEDLTSAKWTGRNWTTWSLKDEIEIEADALSDSSNLITYLLATQNDDGSFGPYANEYGTKAALEALASVQAEVGREDVQTAITKAVNYFKDKYQSGDLTYQVDGTFDYRCVEALAKAGEDLFQWTCGERSLGDTVMESVYSTVNSDLSVQDAVYLAKQLTVLHAMDPESEGIATLASHIREQQKDDGSFGDSIYDHVLVLTALGKAGQLKGIDQTKALEYINNPDHKQEHLDMWGEPAGAGWGSVWSWADGEFHLESDLTAQVLTALSYFDGANQEGTPVYETIQEGLAYLRDVQDDDTAAIVRAGGDSTFATAETLIALKSLGEDYAGTDWTKRSKTKTIAQCLLAVNEWGDTTRRDRLAGLLVNRHGENSFDNSVYSDMWAYLALGEAGKIEQLQTEQVKAYILSKQAEDGSWGETSGDTYYPDFLATTEAIRALSYLPAAESDEEIKTAIENGLGYLKELQQDDGGVYVVGGWDDPAVDNSALVVTLFTLGIDPAGEEWTLTVDGKRVSPVSYLMTRTRNEDGSFGSIKNVLGATYALQAYLLQRDVDLIATVQKAIQYLQGQYQDPAGNDLYKQFGGERAALALTLAGENLNSDRWEKDGKTLAARIREDAAQITADSPVTDIAKALIALSGLQSPEDETEKDRLVGLIADKQQPDGNFADGVIFNEMKVYLALTLAGGWDSLAPEQRNKAKDWLIEAQDDTGSWSHQRGPDTVSTAQAIVVLSGFADADEPSSPTRQAIEKGLEWLKSKQDSMGRITGQGEDPVTNTGETVLAVLAAGQNPKGAGWSTDGSSLLDYLLLRENQKEDGSIGDTSSESSCNVGSTVPALLALLEYNNEFGWVDFGSVQGGGDGVNGGQTPDENKGGHESQAGTDGCEVEVTVIGRSGEHLFGPATVVLTDDNPWGITAMGALHATGLSYSEDGGFIKAIAGQANVGMNGWMYQVNGNIPLVLACDKPVREGDEIIWWYSTDPTEVPGGAVMPEEEGREVAGEKELEIPLEGVAVGDHITVQMEPGEDGTLGVIFSARQLAELEERQNTLILKGESDADLTITISPEALNTDLVQAALQEDPTSLIRIVGQRLTEEEREEIDRAVKTDLGKWGLSRVGEEVYRLDVHVGEQRLESFNGTVTVDFPLPAAFAEDPEAVNTIGVYRLVYDEASGKYTQEFVPSTPVYDETTGRWCLRAQLDRFSLFALFRYTKTFGDIQGHWAQKAIELMASRRVLHGVTQTQFAPDEPVTRAQFTTMLVNALDIKPQVPTTPAFSDVAPDAWYFTAVQTAHKVGLVKGLDEGIFAPNAPITREQMAVMISNALEYSTGAEGGSIFPFVDRGEIAPWAQAGVARVVQEGIMVGLPGNRFAPKATATRAEAAVVLKGILKTMGRIL